MRVIASFVPHTHTVCVSIFIGSGSRYEADNEAGLSHFIEHLCFKGTEKRPSPRDICNAIESRGGILNGGTNKEITLYWCKVTRPNFLTGLDVLTDMLLHSKFDPLEMEKERAVIIEEIKGNLDSPQERADMILEEVLWPDHPLGRDTGGKAETVSNISQEQVLHYVSQHYVPSNTVISIAGGVPPDEALEVVKTQTSSWEGGKPPAYLPATDSQSSPQFRLETRDTNQVYLSLGVRGLPLLHPDRFALDLLNVILGEGMSSRLFLEIREKRGLAYEIYSYASHFGDSGVLGVIAGVDQRRVDVALAAILEVLASLKDPIPEEEVARAKELAKGRLLLRLEDTYAQTSWTGVQELLTGRIISIEEITSIVDSVTPEKIQRVARELLTTEKLNLAVVGPVKQEERLLSLLRL